MPKPAPIRLPLGFLVLLVIGLPARHAGAQAMRVIETPYYVIHTDLEGDDAREAVVRMTRMFELYRFRTRGFAGEIQGRLPFYLYRTREAYVDAGGPKGTAGIFSGGILMATAGGDVSSQTWSVVQHEGFHQFAKAMIRGDLPTWLNEGLAEYFAETVFTGDSFFDALIPPKCLAPFQESMKSGRIKPLKELMAINRDQWNKKLGPQNYDQAWSVVHFLVHAHESRYQTSFGKFILLMEKGSNAGSAWKDSGLPGVSTLESDWRSWWLAQPADPTADEYAQARAETFASYLARAASQKQRFKSFEELAAAAANGTVRTGPVQRSGAVSDDWLPPRLLKQTIDEARATQVRWSIQQTGTDQYRIVADCPDGVRLTTTCLLRNGKTPKIDTDDMGLVIRRARNLLQDGENEQAKALLVKALNDHRNTPYAAEARQLITQAK